MATMRQVVNTLLAQCRRSLRLVAMDRSQQQHRCKNKQQEAGGHAALTGCVHQFDVITDGKNKHSHLKSKHREA